MADYPVSTDIDTFMQSADKPSMRTNMDLGTAATKDVAATGDAASGEVVKGDDTRLTDARTPVSHTHTLSDVTDSGTAASKDVPATGDAASGEVVLGNDSRLTDARTPTSHTHTASEITDFDTEVSNNTSVSANTSKLAGIEAGAEVNNISDTNATDLTDGGDSTLHYHSADRNRSNHTGTQTLSTISDAGTIASQDANSVTITGGSVTGITDLAVADGGTGASTAAAARTNLEVYSDAEVDAKVATKAVAGGVALDGTAGEIDLSAIDAIYPNLTEVTFYLKCKIPTGQSGRILSIGNADSGGDDDGFLVISDEISFALDDGTRKTTTSLTNDGEIHTLIGTFNGTSLTFYVDGVSVGTVSGSHTFARSGGAYIARQANSTTRVIGTFYDFRIFNRALSASDVADLYESGTVAVADRWGGVIENAPWTQLGTIDSFTGITSSGFTVVSSAVSTASTQSILDKVVRAGQTMTVDFDLTYTSGSLLLQITDSSGNQIDFESIPAATGSYSFTFSGVTSDIERVRFRIAGGTAADFAVSNFEVSILGAIADLPLDEGTGTKFYDRSPNNYNATGSDTGITHLVPIEPRDERERLGVTAQLNTKETAGGIELDGGVATITPNPINQLSVWAFHGRLEIDWDEQGSLAEIFTRPGGSGDGAYFRIDKTNRRLIFGYGALAIVTSNNVIPLPTTGKVAYWFGIDFTDGGDCNIWLDGQIVHTATVALGSWLSTSRTAMNLFGFAVSSSNIFGKTQSPFWFFNRALTATEVQDLHDTNTVAVADRWGGTWISPTTDAGNATDPLRQFGSISGASSTGFTGDYDNTNTSNNAGWVIHNSYTVKVGDIVRMTFNAQLNGATDVRIGFGAGSGLTLGGVVTPLQQVTEGANVLTYTITDTSVAHTSYRVAVFGTIPASGSLVISNFSAEKIGAIADLPLDEGIGYQFHDRSSNHFDALASTSGVTHLVPKTEGYIRDFNVDAYNGGSGNVELVSSARAIIPEEVGLLSLAVRVNGLSAVSQITGKVSTGSARIDNVSSTVSLSNSNKIVLTGLGRKPAAYNNYAVSSTDSDATDLNFRVDYKVIER